MLNFQKLNFYNPTRGKLNYQKTIEEVFNYIKEKPEQSYEVVVGCDSSSDERPTFPIAIVVLRIGQGGRFFLTKIYYPNEAKKRFYSFQQRILQEVILSCEIALKFKKDLEGVAQKSPQRVNYKFEYIHADVGVQGKTKDMIKEVVGLIKSNGFEAKIKPESFAASVVADRFA